MIYKSYNCNSFNVHTIKTDKFKTCHMEIVFRKPIKKEELASSVFLGDMLSETSKKYPQHRDVVIALEELYKMVFYSVVNKTGQTLNTSFVADFIAPEYIKEKDYLEKVIKFPLEMLLKPDHENEEFSPKTFNIIKERLCKELKAVQDNPTKLLFIEAFKAMDATSPTAFSLALDEETINKVTPSSLYEDYKQFFKQNTCDIYLIGNLNMDEVVEMIKKHFKLRIINKQKNELYVVNKSRKKPLVKSSTGNFIQANLAVVANIQDLTKKERDVGFHLFNYIFGSGGLTSMLYRVIREENQLCYNLTSMYLKYDNLLIIHVALDNSKVKKAVGLIKKCLKAMAHGDFTEENLEDAKKNLLMALSYNLDNSIAVLNNYMFKILDDLPSLEERKDLIKNTTKKEVQDIAKKIKINTIYTLEGGNNERN